MALSKRSIFRDKALQHYAANRQKDVLPRLVSPPTFLFFWILLILLLIVGVTSWLTRVPTYVVASGVVLDGGITQGQQANDQGVAVIFLPANHASQIHPGQSILLQIASTGMQLSYKVDHIEPGIFSPSAARQRYGLDSVGSQVAMGPSLVLMVSLGPAFPAHNYAGSLVNAQLQVGSQRVLSLLPGLGQWIGG